MLYTCRPTIIIPHVDGLASGIKISLIKNGLAHCDYHFFTSYFFNSLKFITMKVAPGPPKVAPGSLQNAANQGPLS